MKLMKTASLCLLGAIFLLVGAQTSFAFNPQPEPPKELQPIKDRVNPKIRFRTPKVRTHVKRKIKGVNLKLNPQPEPPSQLKRKIKRVNSK